MNGAGNKALLTKISRNASRFQKAETVSAYVLDPPQA